MGGCQKKYGINKRILRNVLDSKLAPMVMKAVETWPRYAYHEDNVRKWRERTESDLSSCGTIQMLTSRGNLPTRTCSASLCHCTMVAMLQKAEFSAALWLAFAGNCGLVQSRIQTTWRRVGFLAFSQELFQKSDATSSISFTNILDKGYRCVLAAWRAGRW